MYTVIAIISSNQSRIKMAEIIGAEIWGGEVCLLFTNWLSGRKEPVHQCSRGLLLLNKVLSVPL